MSNNSEDLNLLKTFCKVAELGSFSKAALALKQPKSRVSRAISRLEESLKTSLIRRTTRAFSLTDQGHQFFQRLNPILTELNTEIQRLDAESEEVSGTLRITSPDDIALYLLERVIFDFSQLYPNVNFHIDLSNDILDLTSDNIDLAFRIGRLKDSTYIQSFLSDIHLVMVASQTYLDKKPKIKVKKDLLDHKFLLLGSNERSMKLKGLHQKPKNITTASQFPLLYNMVKAGHGIGVIPDFYCKNDINSGAVTQLFKDWNIMKTKLHLVYPSKKNLPKRVRLFIDFVKQEIAKKGMR